MSEQHIHVEANIQTQMRDDVGKPVGDTFTFTGRYDTSPTDGQVPLLIYPTIGGNLSWIEWFFRGLLQAEKLTLVGFIARVVSTLLPDYVFHQKGLDPLPPGTDVPPPVFYESTGSYRIRAGGAMDQPILGALVWKDRVEYIEETPEWIHHKGVVGDATKPAGWTWKAGLKLIG